ncbi:MAG: hypothetical protein ACYSYL_00130 [Planctomycetota bacterium]|jgi:hypothetical protein
MAISTVPVISGPLYLRDQSDEVARLEGKTSKEKRAWVSVRQATEQEVMALEDQLPDTKYEHLEYEDETGQQMRKTVEIREDSMRGRFAYQVYCTLVDAGNIFSDKENTIPLFKFRDAGDYQKFDGTFAEFLVPWGKLHPLVSMAIRDCVYDCNPQWDWRPLFGGRSLGEAQTEAEPASKNTSKT